MQDTAFGKYRLIAKLGHGGMAEVFLAVVTGPAGFDKLQVVKKLRHELTEDAEHLAMFLDEARLAARLGIGSPIRNRSNRVWPKKLGLAEHSSGRCAA